MTTNPHNDISIDDYQPDDFTDNPQEYDRAVEHRRHQPAPQDLRVKADEAYAAPVAPEPRTVVADLPPVPDVSDAGEGEAAGDIERRAPGNRSQRRAAEQERARRERRTPAEMAPIEREANGITVTSIEYKGDIYWVPVDPEDWDARATRAFEDGKAMTALQFILEPDEEGRPGYALLESRHYRMKHINELFDKVAEVGGFETAGN